MPPVDLVELGLLDERSCPICQKPVIGRKDKIYCSRRCMFLVLHRRFRNKHRKKGKCLVCGGATIATKKLCSINCKHIRQKYYQEKYKESRLRYRQKTKEYFNAKRRGRIFSPEEKEKQKEYHSTWRKSEKGRISAIKKRTRERKQRILAKAALEFLPSLKETFNADD